MFGVLVSEAVDPTAGAIFGLGEFVLFPMCGLSRDSRAGAGFGRDPLEVTGADRVPDPLVFYEAATVVVGRAPNCDLRVPRTTGACRAATAPSRSIRRRCRCATWTAVTACMPTAQDPGAVACGVSDDSAAGDRGRVGGLPLRVSVSETGAVPGLPGVHATADSERGPRSDHHAARRARRPPGIRAPVRRRPALADVLTSAGLVRARQPSPACTGGAPTPAGRDWPPRMRGRQPSPRQRAL